MSGDRISRNDPCPCGSGKKFKNCCIGKGIDWEARRAPGPRKLPAVAPRPRAASPPDLAFPRPFDIVDARLKELARANPQPAQWKALVEGLSDATAEGERMAAYRAVRDASALAAEAMLFLFDHAVEWMPSEEKDFDRHVQAVLRRHGLADLADLDARDRLDYDRRRERGRQFFFGPPDEAQAARLRESGIID